MKTGATGAHAPVKTGTGEAQFVQCRPHAVLLSRRRHATRVSCLYNFLFPIGYLYILRSTVVRRGRRTVIQSIQYYKYTRARRLLNQYWRCTCTCMVSTVRLSCPTFTMQLHCHHVNAVRAARARGAGSACNVLKSIVHVILIRTHK